MRIFVTGATGFIGRHLVQALIDAGHAVDALVRGGGSLPGACTRVHGDLFNVAGFSQRLAGCDAVIHAAAAVDPIPDGETADRINRRATIDLARAAADQGVESFVFVSSIAAIGIRHLPRGVTPDTPCLPPPSWPYGSSKLAAEQALLTSDLPGLRLAILRPPTVYGPGERRNFLALTLAIDSGLFIIPGRGDNRMSFCHVDNVVQALCLAATCQRVHGVHLVADARAPTFRQIVKIIARQLGRRTLPLPFPLPAAYLLALACEAAFYPFGTQPVLSRWRLKTLTSDFVLDCSSLESLGYRPTVSLEEGVRQTIDWYRAQGLLRRR